MKFLKNLFSRFVINALLIIAQVALFGFFLQWVSGYYIYIHIATLVICYFIVVLIVNKRQNPNLKLPWIVFILLLPVPGTVSYLIFGNQLFPKRRVKRYNQVDTLIKENIEKEVIDVDENVKGQFEYITNLTQLTPSNNNNLTYYNSGEAMYKDIIKDLLNAKEYIFIEFFILSKGMMLDEVTDILKKKVKEGVDVRIIYDDIGSMKQLSAFFNKQIEKTGIKCLKFRPFIPFVSAAHNNRDHRKAIIIDGKVVYTGGINLADEYINVISKFGYWKDNGLKVEGTSVDHFLYLFLSTWDTNYKKKKLDKDFQKFFKKHESVGSNTMLTFGDGPLPVFKEHITENVYLNIINNSKKYLYITTPYLVIDHELMNALKLASKRGVDVRIITPHIPDKKVVFWITRNSYSELIESGVKIYEFTPGFIHSKCILSDDDIAILGTVNFDYRSLVHHFESASLMYNVNVYNDMLNDFNETLEKSEEISLDKAKKINKFKRIIVLIVEIFAPML